MYLFTDDIGLSSIKMIKRQKQVFWDDDVILYPTHYTNIQIFSYLLDKHLGKIQED